MNSVVLNNALRACGLGLLTAMVGCSVLGPRTEPSLDPDSGEMVVALRDAVVYVKSEPGLSQSAHDYLYLGPIETNVSGTQGLYLWVGFASTIDRKRDGISEGDFESVTLTVGAEPLNLSLEPWHTDTSNSPFSTNVPLLQSMRARIDPTDFEALAQSEQVTLTLASADGEEHAFKHWNGQWSDWANASSEAEIGFDVRVHTPGRP